MKVAAVAGTSLDLPVPARFRISTPNEGGSSGRYISRPASTLPFSIAPAAVAAQIYGCHFFFCSGPAAVAGTPTGLPVPARFM